MFISVKICLKYFIEVCFKNTKQIMFILKLIHVVIIIIIRLCNNKYLFLNINSFFNNNNNKACLLVLSIYELRKKYITRKVKFN